MTIREKISWLKFENLFSMGLTEPGPTSETSWILVLLLSMCDIHSVQTICHNVILIKFVLKGLLFFKSQYCLFFNYLILDNFWITFCLFLSKTWCPNLNSRPNFF